MILLADIIWNSPKLWPLATASAVVIAVVVLSLYSPQVKLLGQPWRWTLPILRMVGLIALVLSILKPVAVRQSSPAEAGGVLIVVDRSKSMSIRDLSRMPDETKTNRAASAAGHLVGLADGLGMISPGIRDKKMADLRRDAEKLRAMYDDVARARSEVAFSRVSGQSADAARQRLTQATEQFKTAAGSFADRGEAITKSGEFKALRDLIHRNPDQWPASSAVAFRPVQNSIEEVQNASDLALYQSNAEIRAECEKIAAMSRFDRVEMALTNSSGLLGKIPGDVPLFGYSIAEDAQPLPLRGGGQPARRLLATPDGLRSDLTGGLRSAIAHVTGQPMQAVVIFTDGQQAGADPSTSSALTASGVPIFTVYVANSPLRDIALSKLTVPASCFVGETITARAEVRSSGSKGNAGVTSVSLAVDDAAPTTRPAAFNEGWASAEFPLKFDKAGIHKIVATVPASPDSPTTENKKLERWVKVLSDKVKVGLYAGAANWDFQYVRDAMSRTPWIDLKDAILDSDSAKFPLAPDQILRLDLLLLFDVQAAALTDQQWDAVYKLISERGGSVILVAGDEHLPNEYIDKQLPASLLPFLPGQKPVWRTWPGKDPGFHLTPAPGTENADALKLDDSDSSITAQKWAQLPAFYRYLSLGELKPNAHPLLIDRDSSSPVLVESRLGLGRVFFFGATETWRWRYKIGPKLQDRFWLQLVRYAADEPYATSNGAYALDANIINAEPGQSIRIRARVMNGPERGPSAEPRQTLEIYKVNGQDHSLINTLPLDPTGVSGSGRYSGVIPGLPAGDYWISLKMDTDGNADQRRANIGIPLRIAPSSETEMANLEGSEEPMRHISESSGGAFITLDQIASLPDLISKSRSASSQLTQRPLWDSYYLYFLVLACFAGEWAIRKRMGLL